MLYTINNSMVNDFFQDLDSAFKPSSNFSNGKSYKTETTDDGITLTMETPGYNKNLIDVTVEIKPSLLRVNPTQVIRMDLKRDSPSMINLMVMVLKPQY